jgi:predicted SAM-dependent methyltransferase
MKKNKVRPENLKLDMGCGKYKKNGFYGIDQFEGENVDEVVDVDEGLPFKDNSVLEIYTAHVLEHVKNFEFVVEEMHRVCKPGAKIIIKVPHFSGNSGFYEYHRRFFRYGSFQEFCEGEGQMDVSHKKTVKFKIVRKRLNFLKKWYLFYNYLVEPIINVSSGMATLYELTFLRNLFPAHEVEFEIRVIK